MLVDHMGKGYSFETFSAVIGVRRSTIYNWLNDYGDFLDAKNHGTELNQLFWERVGVQGTVGKLQGWNPTGWIFNMKNRFGWTDRREQEDNTARVHTVKIELPESQQQQVITMKPEQIEDTGGVE